MIATVQRVCQFNNWSLQDNVPYLTVYAIEDYAPDRTLNISPLARRHAQKLSSEYYQKRIIQISIYIAAPSRALVEKSLDILYANIQGNEGQLLMEKSGSVRVYTATYSKTSKNNSGIGRGNALPPQGGLADFTLQFECSDSFGYDTNYTVMMPKTSFSAATRIDSYTQGGGAETQVPFFEVQYTAITGGTNATVMVGNLNTGQTISVTRNWSQYDILQVDCRNKTVRVNGVDVPFTGAFPEFGLGLQSFTYSDTMTTRSYNYLVYVYNRWN